MSEVSILKQIRLFQQDMEGVEIIKNTKAYGYNYATLKDILDIITPVLRKHKIWYSHSTNFNENSKNNNLTTIVYCVDDEEQSVRCHTDIDGETKLGGMNRFMVEGSAITYFRRYHLVTILGLTTDEDSDAGGKKVSNGGRSVEAKSEATKADFIAVFTKQSKTKNKAQFEKTFNAYKAQMEDEDIVAITKIMKDTYGA